MQAGERYDRPRDIDDKRYFKHAKNDVRGNEPHDQEKAKEVVGW